MRWLLLCLLAGCAEPIINSPEYGADYDFWVHVSLWQNADGEYQAKAWGEIYNRGSEDLVLIPLLKVYPEGDSLFICGKPCEDDEPIITGTGILGTSYGSLWRGDITQVDTLKAGEKLGFFVVTDFWMWPEGVPRVYYLTHFGER